MKTLKEFIWYRFDQGDDVPYLNILGNQKCGCDMEGEQEDVLTDNISGERMVKLSDLKKEAIKDIKEISIYKKSEANKFVDDFMGRKTIESKEVKQGIINYIMIKNNLTEEDLK